MRTKGVSPIRCRMFGRMAGAVALGGGEKVRRESSNEETNGLQSSVNNYQEQLLQQTCFSCVTQI